MSSSFADSFRSRMKALRAGPTNLKRVLLTRVKQIIFPLIVIGITWYVAALVVNNPSLLPSPQATLAQIYEITTTRDFRGYTAIDHLRATTWRAVLSSIIALALSVGGGILMSTNDLVEDSISDWLPFWMTTPTIVIIFLSMVWFDFSNLAVIFAAVIASTPFGVVNMWEGAQDVEVDLLTMADSFDASTSMVWRHIFIPHLLPFMFGSFRYILGMVWKLVVLAEVFGLSKGIGSMFRYYFQQGNLLVVFAYVILFISVVVIIEYGILNPLESYLFRWRNSS